MSALVFTLLRIGFLALLWIFVLAVLMTLRRDVYGTQVKNRGVASSSSPPQQRS
jgi:putative FHA domain protein